MIELRRLEETQASPPGDAWVLIEKRDGLFYVSAKSKDGPVDTSGTVGVDSDKLAIRSAEAFADLLTLDAVYIRDYR